MRRRHRVEPRRAIFIGVEGKSDRAFPGFLQRCCDLSGVHVHLNIKPFSGGDSAAIVEAASRHLRQLVSRGEFERNLVLLDRDRVDQDMDAGPDAHALASRSHLEIIYQEPKLEGLLLRLHEG